MFVNRSFPNFFRGYVLLGSESSSDNAFTGRFSKVKLYNEKLEDNDISKLYNNNPPSGTASVIPQVSFCKDEDIRDTKSVCNVQFSDSDFAFEYV